MIQYLSGVEPGELGKRRRTKAERKERRKKFLKNPLKAIKTIAVAPARGAFLLAVSINALKLAKRLAQAYKKNPQKIKDFWKKLGGDEAKLKQAIEKGSKSKLQGGHIGVIAESTIATATPIIIAVLKILKDLKSDKEGDDEKDIPVVDDLKDKLDTDDDDKETDNETDKTTTEKKPFYKNPFVIGGAVLLVGTGIYFATKKK